MVDGHAPFSGSCQAVGPPPRSGSARAAGLPPRRDDPQQHQIPALLFSSQLADGRNRRKRNGRQKERRGEDGETGSVRRANGSEGAEGEEEERARDATRGEARRGEARRLARPTTTWCVCASPCVGVLKDKTTRSNHAFPLITLGHNA
jgi:hypothetical protein